MSEWAGNWSYGYLKGLMAKVGAKHQFVRLADAEQALKGARPVAFIRHDVDVSLDRARALAEKEAEWGVVSTYHVMLRCPFYDLTTRAARHALASINALGHEIGLHFHPPVDGNVTQPEGAAEAVAQACDQFEDAAGAAVRSVSFHLPAAALIGGPLIVADRVNAYAKPLLEWYLSDSRARWREGEPLLSLDTPRATHLQMLVHPLWWGEKNEEPTARLRQLSDELAEKRGEPIDKVADLVYEHILVRPK